MRSASYYTSVSSNSYKSSYKSPYKSSHAGQAGFTLLEVMVAMFIFAVAGAAIVVVVATKKTAAPIQSFKRLIGHCKIIDFQDLKFGTPSIARGLSLGPRRCSSRIDFGHTWSCPAHRSCCISASAHTTTKQPILPQ